MLYLEDYFVSLHNKVAEYGRKQKLKPFESSSRRQKHTNKWLAEQQGKDPATVSKWCTNTYQPDFGSLIRIAQLLELDVNELLRFNN